MTYDEIDASDAHRIAALESGGPTSHAAKATKLHAKQATAQQGRADAARTYQQSLQKAGEHRDPADATDQKRDAAQVYQRKLQRANQKQTAATVALTDLK